MDEMDELYPQSTGGERVGQRQFLLSLLKDPGRWPAMAVYVYAKFATLAEYRWKRFRGRHKEWNRDQSSRQNA